MGVRPRSWDWLNTVKSPAKTNLSNVITDFNRSPNIRGVRLFISIFDRVAMILAEHAADAEKSILIHLPDPYAPSCVYVEFAAHFVRMGKTADHRTDWRIAVVTRNAQLRSVHRRMRIGQLGAIETVIPAETFSGGMLRRFGASATQGATMFVDSVADLKRAPRPDLIVVDAPCYDMLSCINDAPTVFVARDASDEMIRRLADKLPTFSFSASDVDLVPRPKRIICISSTPEATHAEARLNALATGTVFDVQPVFADTSAHWFSRLWADLPSVVRAASHSSAARDLAQTAYRRFYELTHLVVPIDFYERRFGNIISRLASVGSAARLLRGEAREFYVPYVADELVEFAKSFALSPAKSQAFEVLVRRLTATSSIDSVRIAVPNMEMVVLVGAWLDEVMPEHPEVASFSSLARLRPVDHLIITGLPPSWARRALSSGLAKRTHVLGYATADKEIVSEANILAHVREAAEYREAWLSRDAAKADCWAKLTNTRCTVEDDEPIAPTIKSSSLEYQEEERSPSLWGSVLGEWGISTARVWAPGESDGGRVVNALRITLEDGRWVLLSEHSNISTLVNGEAQDGVAADELHVGDVMVLIDSDPRKALLDKIIEAGSKIPEYALITELTQVFRVALSMGYQQHTTYAALLRELRILGCTRTDPTTVRGWVTGKTIGPQDRQDVKRVGQLVGNSAIVNNFESICDAIRAIRGFRVQLGRRLGPLARHHGVDAVAAISKDDELIDDVSGLTVGDFRSCIEFATIRAIEPIGEIPQDMIGALREPETMDSI